MDEKSDIIKMESRVEKSKLVGVSMLLLSLLLTASVASLIYVAVANGNSGCQTTSQGSSDVDVKATVTVKSKDMEVQERVEYSRGGHMSYMYGSNGEFDFDDFRKGIHLTRNNDNGVCYLIPVGANQTVEGHVEEFLEEWDGKERDVESDEVQAKVYGGKLTDVSFLPQKVHDECTSGYQWMAIVPKGEQKVEDGEVSRQKRGYYCYYYYYYCYSYGYYGLCYRLLCYYY